MACGRVGAGAAGGALRTMGSVDGAARGGRGAHDCGRCWGSGRHGEDALPAVQDDAGSRCGPAGDGRTALNVERAQTRPRRGYLDNVKRLLRQCDSATWVDITAGGCKRLGADATTALDACEHRLLAPFGRRLGYVERVCRSQGKCQQMQRRRREKHVFS